MSPDGKSVRGDRFPVADAFEERVAGDDVFVFTCSVVILVLLFDLKKKNRKEVSALILVIIREKSDYRENTRARSNQKTNGLKETMNTYRLWSPCSFCSASRRTSRVEQHYHQNRLNLSLVVGVARGVVLFLLLCLLPRCCSSSFFFSRSRVIMNFVTERQKKKTETHKKRSLGFMRYPKYTFLCVVPAFLSFSDCCFRLILSYRLVGGVTI